MRPSRPPKAMPASGRDERARCPRIISFPATTAEKLNIQPMDRSMSRMTTTKTMPTASMPVKALLDSSWSSDFGCRKIGLATPMNTISATSATMTPVSSGRRDRRERVGRPPAAAGSPGAMAAESSVVKRLPWADLVTDWRQ